MLALLSGRTEPKGLSEIPSIRDNYGDVPPLPAVFECLQLLGVERKRYLAGNKEVPRFPSRP